MQIMNINNGNGEEFIKIMWVTALSFFTAFVKELNDKAKNPSESFFLFVSEVLLHGVCGALFGIITLAFTSNVYVISVCAGIGGLLGMQVVKITLRIAMTYYSAIKKIELSDIKLDDDEK